MPTMDIEGLQDAHEECSQRLIQVQGLLYALDGAVWNHPTLQHSGPENEAIGVLVKSLKA